MNALSTGTDATDLSDFEAAELDDIDTDLSTATQLGACTESEIWRMIYANDEPDDTDFDAYFCGSRPNKQVRFNSDPDVYDVRPYSEIYDIHPHKNIATTHSWINLQIGKHV